MSIDHFNFGTSLNKAGAPTSGVFQVETTTVVGTITLAGNATAVVTAANMAGSPITVPVAVADTDTATIVAGKVRAALGANATISAFFTIGGAGAAVVLTAKNAAANDATMNLLVDDDTSAGLTTANSVDTTAGVAGDFHGVSNGTILIDTTNRIIYQNTGDHLRAVWTAQ
jgi:hypothetical protein